jgi:anti-anti-sigma factor
MQRFRGAVRETTIHDFESRLREGGERSPYYVVDLSELEYIDAAGLGRLLDQSVAQQLRGGWLRVVAASPAVAMIFHLSGVSDSLTMAATEDEALKDLPERAA